jgi:hypothetical protein
MPVLHGTPNQSCCEIDLQISKNEVFEKGNTK